MITRIYLEEQPTKSIDYPDCYPTFIFERNKPTTVRIAPVKWAGKISADYLYEVISRIEVKP